MSSGFAKLDSGIVDSTLWMQPHDVLRVWIAMLAKCDSYGIVRASVPAMAHLCLMTNARFEEIIAAFTAPDPYSRTNEDDGRRLRVVEGGWVIINYIKYRELVQTKPQSHAERQRKYRERVTERDRRTTGDATVTTIVTRDAEAEAEAEAKAEEKKEEKKEKHAPKENPSTLDSPTFINLILNDGKEYSISEDQVREFSGLYPAVQIHQAFREMRAWCVSNPTKRKTRGGILRFVNIWLSKAQNESGEKLNGNRALSRNDGAAGKVQAAIDERKRGEERFALDG